MANNQLFAKEMPIFPLIIMYSLQIVLMKAAIEQRDVMAWTN